MAKFAISLLASLIVIVSCTPQQKNITFQTSGESIIGGRLSDDKDFVTRSTVAIYDHQGNGSCSGTLIAKNVVLTAAHCLDSKARGLRVVFSKDMSDALNAKEPDVKDNLIKRVAEYRIHPGYEGPDPRREYNHHDIGLVRFIGDLPEGYQPVEFVKNKDLLKPGQSITVAGYGVTAIELIPVDPQGYPNLHKSIEDGDIFCLDDYKDCFFMETDGGDLLKHTEANISLIHDAEFSLDESKGQATCVGDSGGPAYLQVSGKTYVAGVTSRGSALCNEEGVYTSTAYYTDWINDTLLQFYR